MTLDDVINAKITNALFAARITSANPTHTNYIMDTQGFGATGGGVSQEFDAELDALIEQKISQLTQAGGDASEPGGFGATDALRAGRQGLSGAPDIMSILTQFVPQLIPLLIASGAAFKLFEWAKGPGGPIDIRYKRDIINETFNFLSRQLQRDTEVGNRQLIIQSDANFKNLGGAGNSNTLRQIRDRGDRLADVGLLVHDRAKGLERLG